MGVNVGDRIWRMVEVLGENKTPSTHEFEKTDRGTWVYRALMTAAGFYRVNTDSQTGLVCFCNTEIPEEFTYFEVVSSSEKYCITVPIIGDMDMLFAQYPSDEERIEMVNAGITRMAKRNPRKLVDMLGIERIARTITKEEIVDLINYFYERKYGEATHEIADTTIAMAEMIEKIRELKDMASCVSSVVDPSDKKKIFMLECQKKLHDAYVSLKEAGGPP